MPSPSQASVSFSQFESITSAALNEFKEKTGKNLLDDWLAKELQSCDSVEAVMDIIQGQAKAFDKFRNGGSKLMKWISSSVHVLYTISAALGDSVGVVIPSAKAVFTGIGVLLAAAKDVRASHGALVDLFERIQFFLKRLGVHTRISPTKDMVEILVKIMAEVISILSIATKEMQQSRTKIYVKKLLGRTDIEDALKKLDGLTQEEVRMAITQVLQGIKKLQDDAKKINGAMQGIAEKVNEIQWNQIEQDIRRWLSSPDPTVNYNIARKIYQEGTAVWFLEGGIFKEWDLIGSLLWIHGKPGSGKSILCASIIKHVISLRDAGSAALAYYYFDFRDEEKRNLRNFVTSLLTQLSDYSEPCRDIIHRLYSTHGKGTRQPDIDVLIDYLKEVLKVVIERPVYVIVDALDECPGMSGMPTPRETVLNLVEDLAHMQLPALHVCITSRPEVDIKEVLEPLAYCAVSLHGESGQQKDILNYVKAVVSSDRKMRKWRDEEKKLVVEELSNKVDGMFRWAFCQLEVLRHCLPASIRPTLDQLPDTLDETYARVLSQIPQANQAQAHRLLQCLVVAVRPLRVAELAELLAFEFDTSQGAIPRYRADWQLNDQEQAVLSTCSSLIAIVDDDGSQIVQFSHFSVEEFLMSDRLTSSLGDFSRYQIVPGLAHTLLAQACLGFLLHLNDQVDKESGKGFPLAEYAARHWVAHAQFEEVRSRVRNGIESLFDSDKPHFAAWVGICDIDERPYWESPSEMPTPLYYSSLCGFSDLVEHLAIKHPQHVNAIGGRYEFPLVAALSGKHIKVAEILLNHGANVNIQGTGGGAPLHELIEDVSVVQFLLNHGADANCQRQDNRTPLHLALPFENGRGVARVLLQHGADANVKNERGETPLHQLFVDYGSDDYFLDLARLLLEHGTDVNARRNHNHMTPLHLAIISERYKCARILLEYGADASAQDYMGQTPLHLTFRRKCYRDNNEGDFTRFLLEKGADVNRRNNDNKTPLHLAINSGMFKCVKVLLEHGADPGDILLRLLIDHGWFGDSDDDDLALACLLLEHGADANIRTTDESTLLHYVALYGYFELARVLLDHGANVNTVNKRGTTPLHEVSRGEHDVGAGRVGIVRLLLERGASVNASDKDHDTTLHLAAFWGRLEIAQVLLKCGASPNAKNKWGETPLHIMSRGKDDSQEHGVGIARLLLEHGTDVHAQDEDYDTALHSAAYWGRLELAQVLLKCGATPNAKNKWGETPLHILSRGKYDSREHGVGIARLLLEHGTDVHARDEDHDTALHLAAYWGRPEFAQVLLKCGAGPNTKNKRGETPLHILSRGEYKSQEHGVGIARLLLEHGTDVHARDEDHGTTLHSAAFWGRLKLAQVLLECGANPNAKNKWGETPLHLLSPGKYYPQEHGVGIARLLLDRGADVNAPDKDQFTPFYFASHFRRFDIAQLLIEYGLKNAESSSQGTKRKADDVTVGSRSEKTPKLHEDASRAMGTRTLHQP